MAAFPDNRKLLRMFSRSITVCRTTMKAFPQTGEGAERSEADEGDEGEQRVRFFLVAQERIKEGCAVTIESIGLNGHAYLVAVCGDRTWFFYTFLTQESTEASSTVSLNLKPIST